MAEPRLTDEELLAIRQILREDNFNIELKKRLGNGLVTAEKITSALVKIAITIGVAYAGFIVFLKDALGISK
jgi:hypothetical protein